VWYPLRRSGKFAQLPADEQRVILAEHGAIGMSFGAGDSRTTSASRATA
jgi:chlorite dismutase